MQFVLVTDTHLSLTSDESHKIRDTSSLMLLVNCTAHLQSNHIGINYVSISNQAVMCKLPWLPSQCAVLLYRGVRYIKLRDVSHSTMIKLNAIPISVLFRSDIQHHWPAFTEWINASVDPQAFTFNNLVKLITYHRCHCMCSIRKILLMNRKHK